MQMGLLYKTNFFLLAFNAWGKNCLWINIMHSHGLLQNMLEVEICLRSFFGLKKSYLNRFIMQARGNALQFYAIFESLRKAHCSLFTVFTMVSSSLTTLSWEIKLSIMSFHFLPGSWWTLRWSGTENLLLATVSSTLRPCEEISIEFEFICTKMYSRAKRKLRQSYW